MNSNGNDINNSAKPILNFRLLLCIRYLFAHEHVKQSNYKLHLKSKEEQQLMDLMIIGVVK